MRPGNYSSKISSNNNGNIQDKKFVAENQIGKQCPSALYGNARGIRTRPFQKNKNSKGSRFAKSADTKLGRRSALQWAKDEVKQWIRESEQDGHGLEDTDVMDQFEEVLAKRLFEVLHLEKHNKLEENGVQEKKIITEKLDVLKKHKSRARELTRLLVSMGSRMLKPARRTCLTKPEEGKRCHLTWQQFDWVMQTAIQGGHELEKRVLNPDLWMAEVDQCIISTEDEVPLWIGLSKGKKVYSEETVQNQRKFRAARKRRRERLAVDEVQENQQALEEGKGQPPEALEVQGELSQSEQTVVEKLADQPLPAVAKEKQPSTLEEDEFGLFQLRGEEKADETRRRITWVNRPAIKKYFQEAETPLGFLFPEVIVVPGQHCRLASISSEGTWLRDETYMYKGKEYSHKTGESVGNQMQQWRTVRARRPDLFRNVQVYSQPAAFRDEVIFSWNARDLHEASEGKPLIVMHDLVAGQSSQGTSQTRFLLNQMTTFVAADMTPVLQLVDIYSAKKGKDIVNEHKGEIRNLLREEAKRTGTKCEYKCGALAIMVLVNKIHEGLNEDLQKKDWIIHHMRQAGHLAYRPSVDLKKLVDTDDEKYKGQQWLRQHPMAGGGKIEVVWRMDRHKWIDEEGMVKKPKWEEQNQMADAAMEIRTARKQIYLDEQSILVTAEEQDIFDENSSMLQMHPAVRNKKFASWLRDSAGDTSAAVIGMKDTQVKKQRLSRWKYATQILLEHYRDGVRADLASGLSKEDLISQLVPQASKCRQSKKSKKKSSGHKLSRQVRNKWRLKLKSSEKNSRKKKVIKGKYQDAKQAAAAGALACHEHLLGQWVLVHSEQAGQKSFGFVGKVAEIDKGLASVVDERVKHKVQVKAAWLQQLAAPPQDS